MQIAVNQAVQWAAWHGFNFSLKKNKNENKIFSYKKPLKTKYDYVKILLVLNIILCDLAETEDFACENIPYCHCGQLCCLKRARVTAAEGLLGLLGE